ncbi:hypothetical protein EYF80_036107 [Liparis tanakae]|uniref:Uncharacterized protein n=1 Tax=Liparis tanakae TaxID=230148 RepID=A0A4Z2GKI7_9TELE|nr:hypothetical protein EYF80_036107 [Liparis tanakae]
MQLQLGVGPGAGRRAVARSRGNLSDNERCASAAAIKHRLDVYVLGAGRCDEVVLRVGCWT